MKTLNKTLSLVLVLVMVLGMFGVASAAKLGDFSDKDDVTYTEAVDYLTAAGIVAGDTATTINPKGDFTREQAAKLVAYAMLGQVAADNLRAATDPFEDVAADRWSAGYIAYCQKQGIINGYGDGNFGPADKVTGYQVAKMLLCSIGYGVNGELSGAGWELETARLALSYGIFTDNTKGASNTAANREEAFLYTFNTLSSLRSVSYNKNLDVYYVPGGNALQTNPVSQDATRKDTVGAINFGMTLSGTSNGVYGQPRHLWQKDGVVATDKYSDDPVKTLATSNNGTSLTALTSKSSAKYIKFEADDTTVNYYYNGAAVTKLAVANNEAPGVAVANGDYVLLDDGVIYQANTDIAAATAFDTSSNIDTVATVDGTRGTVGLIVSFIDTDCDSDYDAVAFTHKTSLQLAAAPVVKTTGSLTQVTIAGLGTKNADDIEYPAGLAKGDVILYYVSGGTTYVEKAEVITGKLTAFANAAGTTPDTVTIDGTKYVVSGLENQNGSVVMTGSSLYNATKGVENVAFYLDNSGAVCFYYTTTNVTMANTLYVAATDTTTSFGMTTYKAKALFGDGTAKDIVVSKVAAAGGTLTAVSDTGAYSEIANGKLASNLFYTYAVNSDGTYNLTAVTGSPAATAYQISAPVASATTTADTTTIAKYKALTDLGAADESNYLTITNGKANFLTETKNTGAAAWGSATAKDIIANASTVFAVYNGTTKTYDIYMGIANVPTINVFPMGATTTKAVFPVSVLMNSSGTAASLVIVNANNEKDTSTAKGDYVFALGLPNKTIDGPNEYYTLTALVNGVPGTIKLDNTCAGQVVVGSGFWKVTTKDANGVIVGVTNSSTLGTHISSGASPIVTKITTENNVLCAYDSSDTLQGTGLLSSSTACYVMNVVNGTFEKVDASALGLEIYGKTVFVDWVETSADDDTIAIVIATIVS